MREAGKLSALKIGKIVSRAVPGRYGDGRGLYLQISQWGSAAWLFRYVIGGRERQMGLGSLGDVPLALARQRAREYRNQLWSGADPIDQRRQLRADQHLARAREITFEAAAKEFIAAHESGWKSAAHRGQWNSSLKRYAFPILGRLVVADIDTALILRCLEPIWGTKRETASRVRGRIEAILDWATVHGFREGDNPAVWRGRLEHLLPSKAPAVEHYKSMPYVEVPRFVEALRGRKGVSTIALQFLVLTASRTSEALKATWDEFNLEEKVWVIPPARMKAGAEHRVPLSIQVVELLGALPREGPLLFPGARAGRPLAQQALLKVMQRHALDYVPHGFRSSFAVWAGERTNFPHEIREAALAHKMPTLVERAYQRTTFFDRRRQLMDQWGRFCTTPTRAAGETLVALRGQRI